jgi:ribose transport system ATP-binding protein
VTIRLSNISKFYSGVPALRDVSADFYCGEVHAILGENGAGKSTLMNIISGTVHPELGEIRVGDRRISHMSPELAASLGIAISFQHPAILDDLSVLENLQVALPPPVFAGRPATIAAKEMLDTVGLHVPLRMRAAALTVAQKHLLEIAKALATKPKVLLLDEPTASLDQDSTEMLFERIRAVVKAGTSVIYITHRLAELRQIAHRVTVLRDGRIRGGGLVNEVGDAELLGMIVGRELGSTFPPKPCGISPEVIFSVRSLSGRGFKDISFDIARGQIIGVAGVEGNGQSELMRALAGLQPSDGVISLQGRSLKPDDLLQEAAFMPSDRHAEGLAAGLTVRENAAFAALDRFSTLGFMVRKKELAQVGATFSSLAVKASSIEAPVLSLSGGNQQKVVMSRALLSEPRLLVADEPTQGVDVGARSEIYRILREVSRSGTPVVVNSSDAAELEGLCDQVIVLSRGRAVATLTGADVSEARIVAAAVNANIHVGDSGLLRKARRSAAGGLRHFLQSDNAPAVPLALVTVLLGLYVFSQNAHFLSAFNVSNILMLATALGFIALGQTVALLLGAIDLSVGPLAGFLVVAASFFINDDKSTLVIAAGFALIFFGCICRRRDQRASGPICQFHAHSGDAGHVHRLAGHEFPSARQSRRLHRRECRGGRHLADRSHPRGVHRFGRARRRGRISAAPYAAWLAAPSNGFARGVCTKRRRFGQSRLPVRLHFLFSVDGDGRGDADVSDRGWRSTAGNKLHALQHNRGRPWRDKPARRSRHIHRHGAWCGLADGSLERCDVPGPCRDLSIRIPGRAHRPCRAHLLGIPEPFRRVTSVAGDCRLMTR